MIRAAARAGDHRSRRETPLDFEVLEMPGDLRVLRSALDRLGERFFRVEASRNRQLGGAGLGLALSRRILEAHAGRMEFGPSPLGGLRATIVLMLEG